MEYLRKKNYLFNLIIFKIKKIKSTINLILNSKGIEKESKKIKENSKGIQNEFEKNSKEIKTELKTIKQKIQT